jgi:organic hydroperoxide reductase OsmC/OhrA
VTRIHTYRVAVSWTGNTGSGTACYRGYERAHRVAAPGKPDLVGSSDPVFRGDPSRWNPEELLVASLSACHMLVYLHQAAISGVVVSAYEDEPVGEMVEAADDSGQFRRVVLQPTVTVSDVSMVEAAGRLHEVAHDKCFIANSVTFPVTHRGTVVVKDSTSRAEPARLLE